MQIKNIQREKIYYLIIALIIAIGAILRALAIYQLYINDPNVTHPQKVTDMATYYTLAKLFFEGRYFGPFKYQPLYYTLFVPIAFYIFGINIWGILILQGVIGVITIIIATSIAKKIFGEKSAIITALLLAFAKPLIFYEAFMLIATIQTFLLVLALYFTLLTVEKRSFIYFIASGLTIGLSIAARGNIWIIFFAIALYLLFSLFKSSQNKLKTLFKFIIFVVATMLPTLYYSYHNSVILGKITGPSIDAGMVLSFGNTPESPPAGNDPSFNMAGIAKPNEVQKYWLQNRDKISITARIAHFFIEHPLQFLELNFRKALLFWDYREIPNNVNINKEYLLSPILKYVAIIPSAIFIILGLSGFFISLRYIKDVKRSIIAIFLISYWVSIAIFYILARFRIPIIPILGIYSGYFIASILDIKKKERKEAQRSYIGLIIALIVSSIISIYSYPIYRKFVEKRVFRLILPHGNSISLGNKRVVVMDNGPMIFGGWKSFKLRRGDEISKTFDLDNIDIIKRKQIKRAYLHIPIATIGNSIIEIKLYRKKFTFYIANGQRYIDLPIPENILSRIKNRKRVVLDLKITYVRGKVYLWIDMQRNYNRTKIDKKYINGELVSKLILD